MAACLHLQLLLQKGTLWQARLGVPWPLIQPLYGVLPLLMAHTIHVNMTATCGFMAKRWERALVSLLAPEQQGCKGQRATLAPEPNGHMKSK